MKFAPYAHESYVARQGLLAPKVEYSDHTFACSQTKTGYTHFPFTKWFANNVPASSIALQTEHQYIAEQAVLLGTGIGLHPIHEARKHPELIQVLPHGHYLWICSNLRRRFSSRFRGPVAVVDRVP